MKLKTLLLAATISIGLTFTASQETQAASNLAVKDPTTGVYTGFIGTPLLEENGYQAEKGAFDIEVGSGLQDLDNITDADPSNFATAINVADLSLVLNERVKVMPKDTENAPVYPAGTEAGFVLDVEGTGFSLLDVKVIKFFVLYFYKDGKCVATQNAGEGDDLNVLGLSLISVGDKKQKITAKAPEDFDGIALGTAGVDADVINNVKIYYAFVDNFVETPIIKRYYPLAQGSTQGMVSGGSNLVNNNLKDGATTAVLNIGGAYYNVMSNATDAEHRTKAPFPAGIEAGFVMTTGTVLNLDLGKAIKIMAYSYPKVVIDGVEQYNFNAEPIVVQETDVSVDGVGLQLIGGGQTKVSFMTTEPAFGFRLERISGIDVDLGATVVHYAYAKLPELPEEKSLFEVELILVNGNKFDSDQGKDPVNHRHNHIHFVKGAKNPLKNAVNTKSELNLWHNNGLWEHGVQGRSLKLGVVRKTTKTDGTTDKGTRIGYMRFDDYNTNSVVWKFYPDGKGTWEKTEGTISVDENGVLDLSSICFTESNTDILNGPHDTDNASYEYILFFDPKATGAYGSGEPTWNEDNVSVLSTDIVTLPTYTPTTMLSGSVTYEDILADEDDLPKESIELEKYHQYVVIELPELVDWKTKIDSFTLYKYKGEKDYEIMIPFKKVNGRWQAEDENDPNPLQIIKNGVSRIFFRDKDINSEINKDTKNKYYYSISTDESLTDTFQDQIVSEHNPTNLNYGCPWLQAEACNAPQLSLSTQVVDQANYFITTHNLSLNQLAGHDELQDGEILYSQWVEYVDNNSNNVRRRIMRASSDNEEGGAPSLSKAESQNTVGITHKHNTSLNTVNASSDMQVTDNYEGGVKTGETATAQTQINFDQKLFENESDQTATKDIKVYSRAYIPVTPTDVAQTTPSYVVVDSAPQTITLTRANIPTDVEVIEAADADMDAEYFTLDGLKVEKPEDGLFVVRKGNETKVVYVK